MYKCGVFLIGLLLFFASVGCKKESTKKEVWIYGSIYKDTIADIEPKLKIAFPEVNFKFYQAGSEEITAKVNAEMMAGGTKSDILIFSDRFWFEEAARQGLLHKYVPKNTEDVFPTFRNKDGYYTAGAILAMILIYNSDVISESDAPKTFKEMMDPKWNKKFATGSPLASGTNFTTVAVLQKMFGWDYFKALRTNDTISEGGSSAVIRRVQAKERPVGWVLLENALRLQDKDPKIKIVYPLDGPIVQSNVIAITKKDKDRSVEEKIVDWFFSEEGQSSMVASYMYSVHPLHKAPRGARPLNDIMKTAPVWSDDLVTEIMNDREKIKEEFSTIMF